MEMLLDKPTVKAPATVVMQSAHGSTMQGVVLTPEQVVAFCALKATAAPPTPALVAAAARPRRFRIDVR